MGEILMPAKYVPKGTEPDHWIEAFVYLDSEDRPIATTEKPLATVGEFAVMKAVAVNKIGAFMHWGLIKDLLVPFAEQHTRLQAGREYMVRVLLDENSNRIMGSTRITQFLNKLPADFETGEEVEIQVFDETDIGYRVIIHNAFSGMLYKNETFDPLEIGQELRAFIKQVREDNKIDLTLTKPGYAKIGGMADRLLKYIERHNGRITLTDKSPADLIYAELKMSKKNFKKAIGMLYKARLIKLEPRAITLLKK